MPSYLSVFLAATSLVAALAAVDPLQLETSGDANLFSSDGVIVEANSTDVAVQGSWTSYKQCDSRWANQQLGTCSKTICQAGCAMTSVAMILQTKGANQNPSTLDKWLTKNGGYANGCNIYWAKVDAFGKTTFRGIQKANEQEICNGLKKMHGIVANVNGGGHWVLLTGCKGNGYFSVHDPGYNRDSYHISEIVQEAVYW